MSPLTKAFVVLTTLLSIVMVSMTVAHVARTEDYRAKYVDMKTDRDNALALKAQFETAVSNNSAAAQEVASSEESELSKVQGQLRDARALATSNDEEVATLRVDIRSLTAAQQALSTTLNAANTRIDTQNDQIRTQIQNLATVSRQKSEAEQALVNAIAARNRYENEVRLLSERLRAAETAMGELQIQNDQYASYIRSLGDNPDEVEEAANSIRIAGSVTGVDQVGEGLTFVEVNVGTRDGVQEGMPFTVFRGDQYLGTIRITNVDTDMAVGEVTLLVNAIRADDSIKTRD